jgi:predicted nucleic acid-binding Zn ribbon protein
MTGKKKPPEKIDAVLSAFLEQSGLAGRVEQAAVVPEWEQLEGAQIAAVTTPIMISRDGTLFVAVRTSAWMQELSLMEPQLLQALNARTGGEAKDIGGGRSAAIERIHWRLAG